MSAAPDVLGGIRDILCDLLLRKRDDVRPESLLVQDLEVDSLGLIELTFAIEEKFGVEFPDLKTSAEILIMSLPDGIRRIAAMPGGTTLFEFIERELARTVAGNGAPDARDRDRLLRTATVGDLARAVGGAVPIALSAPSRLGELHVADLFRVVTVDLMARYVEFLRAQQAAGHGSA